MANYADFWPSEAFWLFIHLYYHKITPHKKKREIVIQAIIFGYMAEIFHLRMFNRQQ